jgi:hypothetical protein
MPNESRTDKESREDWQRPLPYLHSSSTPAIPNLHPSSDAPETAIEDLPKASVFVRLAVTHISSYHDL